MSSILGQGARFVHCTRYTSLTDELSRLSNDLSTRVVIISSLTGIVVSLLGTSEVKKAIGQAMNSLAASVRELVHSNSSLRLFIAPCTPRNLENFQEYASHALVKNQMRI